MPTFILEEKTDNVQQSFKYPAQCLTAAHVAVLRIHRFRPGFQTNGAFDGNLDRFCRFEFNDIDDFIRRNFVKITNQIFIDRFGGTNLFKIFEGFEP